MGEKRWVNIVQLVVNTPIFYGRSNKTPTNMWGIFKDSAMPFRVTIDAQDFYSVLLTYILRWLNSNDSIFITNKTVWLDQIIFILYFMSIVHTTSNRMVTWHIVVTMPADTFLDFNLVMSILAKMMMTQEMSKGYCHLDGLYFLFLAVLQN